MSKTIEIKAKMLPVPYLCSDADAVHWKNLFKGQTNTYSDKELKCNVIDGWLFKYKAFYKVTDGANNPGDNEPDPVPPQDEDPTPENPSTDPNTDYTNPDNDYGTGDDNEGVDTTASTDQVSDQDETLSESTDEGN